MPKAVTLGNGSVLICLDKWGQVRDFYYHYAGHENHVSDNLVHKIGVYVDDKLHWVDKSGWKASVTCEKDTMASQVALKNSSIGIGLSLHDVVYNEKNIYVREVKVKNEFDRKRKLKLFFNQQFNISDNHHKDTAYYGPYDKTIIHYEGRRAFLTNVLTDKPGIDEFSIGLIGIEGKEGTYKDAEDGKLTGSPIEHGNVDSVISVELDLKGNGEETIYYWIAAGKSIKKTRELNKYVIEKSPKYIIDSTKNYWNAWVKNQNFTFFSLSDQIIDLFNKSLVNIRTHVSKNGSIIASGDSDMLQYGRDTYAYMWPRDAAISAIALAKVGDFNASSRFFEFCNNIISKDGYFMHKYRPDGSIGSSWHPWIRWGEKILPIQEDETALVINALATHFKLSKDLEFIESIYNSMIKAAGEFMCTYFDEEKNLPNPSYDLWEEKYGIHTFTAASVYGALNVSHDFAELLGKKKAAVQFKKKAEQIKKGIMEHLYDEESKTFIKSLAYNDGEYEEDKTLDISSVYGIYKFGVLPPDNEILKKAIDITRKKLTVDTKIGGIARYEGDVYHHQGGNVPGNPWFITTLWMTQYNIEFLKEEKELPELVKEFTWVVDRASSSGILSEQLNPYDGTQLSAAPLTWSHAEYVISVIKYLEKLEELGICKACYPVNK